MTFLRASYFHRKWSNFWRSPPPSLGLTSIKNGPLLSWCRHPHTFGTTYILFLWNISRIHTAVIWQKDVSANLLVLSYGQSKVEKMKTRQSAIFWFFAFLSVYGYSIRWKASYWYNKSPIKWQCICKKWRQRHIRHFTIS